jgi:hypothetical protein
MLSIEGCDKFKLKEGMRMHPFLDRSGLVFFDPKRTLVSSLSVTEEIFSEWLSSPSKLSGQEVELLNTLVQQGFVVSAD